MVHETENFFTKKTREDMSVMTHPLVIYENNEIILRQGLR